MRQLHLSTIDTPTREGVDPIFKWAGGKRWLAPTLALIIREKLALTGGRYFEPFLGGAAVALWLKSENMFLSDIESPLIEAYVALKKNWTDVYSELEALIRLGTDEDNYRRIRADTPTGPESRAARLLYLNRLCFNGLYRTNRRGQFNVPYGRYSKPAFPTKDHLRSVSTILSGAEVLAQDFAVTVSKAQAGDVIFVDPPYHSARTGFVSYHHQPFTPDEQVRLAEEIHKAAQRGVTIFGTNSDTELIRNLYKWAPITVTNERRAINSIGSRRGRIPCILIGVTVDQLVLNMRIIARQ
jgi:DNA adenine methylase